VRQNVENKCFVHLAAHGLARKEHDNCFGTIALSPPSSDLASGTNDGFLELREIQLLPLQGCELAVLSACETNVGPDRRREAGTTLAQAFLIAGAKRVVCSHWNVEDESTATMVGAFFERIAAALDHQETVNYAAAIHDAKKKLRDSSEWSDPYRWAPFVLIGPQ
jgi:CHAT domain-containing protein